MGVSRRTGLLAVLTIVVTGCATPAPFPLLGEARECIRHAESAHGAEGGDELLSKARGNLSAAWQQSEREQARHFAYLALQQCRTARSEHAARQSIRRAARLETDRIHLQAGLRNRLEQVAENEQIQLASRLRVKSHRTRNGLEIPLDSRMFTPRRPGLAAAAGPLLEEVVRFLHRHPVWSVSVASATDGFARRRATSVRHSLIARGIRPERIALRAGPDTAFVNLIIARPR